MKPSFSHFPFSPSITLMQNNAEDMYYLHAYVHVYISFIYLCFVFILNFYLAFTFDSDFFVV